MIVDKYAIVVISKVRRFEIIAVFEGCRWRRTLQPLVRCVAVRLSLFLRVVDGDAPYSHYCMSFEN
jgi:hypothetical protein